jgi:ABC-type antimicrobial peptide transport system permease subunit
MTGLYTLVSLSILNRTKEVGIRKVMGAPVRNIFLVLSRGFLINLAISSIVGCVGGYFLSEMLLDSIWDMFLDFSPGIYVWSVLIMFTITVSTMAGKIVQAAHMNPAVGLRYE